MKKLLYSTLAIAAVLAASCSQEISKNNSNELALLTGKHEVVYKGLASNVTKTAYADDKTFSWEAGEVVYVVTGPQSDESEDQYLHGSVFTGDVAGTVTNFKGEVADGQEAYLALYPSFGRLFVNNYIAAYLPPTTFVDLDDDTYYTVKSTNPLSNLPLIGVPDDANEVLQFHTATGAAKFTFKGLTPGKKLIRIYAEDEKLSGYFTFDNGLYTNDSALSGTYSIKTTYEKNGETRDTTYTYNCSNKYVQYILDTDSEGTATFYAPLPVGKIGAGSTVYIYDYDMETDNATLAYSRVLASDLEIKENAVATVAPLTIEESDWESVGTGKFIDNYLWSMFKFTEGEYVDVAIMRDKNNKNLYRMENPFSVAKTKFGFTNSGEATADEYFEFTALPSNGKVLYDEVNTGLFFDSVGDSGEATIYASPSLFTNADASRNIVVKFQADGTTPSSIQLDPVYYWYESSYWSWFTAGVTSGGIIGTKTGNNIAQILFPGETGTYDLSLSVSYTGDTVVDEKGAAVTATVVLGDNLTGAQLVVAQDAASAKAAIEAGTNVTTITASDTEIEVVFPEDAVTGTYYVYAYSSVTDGLTEACRQLLAADTAINYFNPDDPDKYTLDDIIGEWESSSISIYVYGTGWYYNRESGLTFAASDDEDSGNIMMTAFDGDTFDTPLYGFFDTQKGLFQAPASQIVINNYNGQTGTNQRGMAMCDYDGAENLLFYIEEDGTLTYCHGDGMLMPTPTFKGIVQEGYWFEIVYSDLVFDKVTASGAPLKAMGKSSSKTNYVEVGEVETIPAHFTSQKISCKQKTQEPMFLHLGHEGRRLDGVTSFGIRK